LIMIRRGLFLSLLWLGLARIQEDIDSCPPPLTGQRSGGHNPRCASKAHTDGSPFEEG
jgi:hypothetical protein